MKQILTIPGLRNVLILLIALLVDSVRAQNVAWIDTASAGPHQSIRFSLCVLNAEAMIAFQSDIVFPSALAYAPNSAQLTSRANGHSFTASMIAPNTLRIIGYSLSANALNGSNGPVVFFDCLSGTQPGEYSVGLENVVISNAAQQNICNSVHSGKFILLAPDIQLSNDSLDFGSIPLGQSLDLPLTIQNIGNLPLTLTSISSSLAEIGMLDSSGLVIDAQGSTIRTVRFRPIVKGIKTGMLTIKCNDPVDSVRYIKLKSHAYAVNEIHIGSASARSGYSATIRIRINNMEPFTAFQCKMPLPSVMKYVSGSARLVGRNANHSISADTVSGNVLQLVCFSPTNAHIQDGDGDIAELNFYVEGQGGNYGLPITSSIISDSTGTNILSAAYAGDLRIAAPTIQLSSASVNIGSVSIYDTARTQIQIDNAGDDTLFISSAMFTDTNYTVESTRPFVVLPGSNNNMKIRFHNGSRGTFPTQLTMVHNDVPRNPSKVLFSASTHIPNTLVVDSLGGRPGDTLSVSVRMENAEPIVALQFDLAIPSELQLIPGSVMLSSRSNQHSIATSIISDGILRVVAFSMDQNPFYASTGDVVYLKIILSMIQGVYPLTFSNVVLSNAANMNVVSACRNGAVSIEQLTSVTFRDNYLPPVYGLRQNYPNPFNPSTTICYVLRQRAFVTLTVANALGQQVAILVSSEVDAGYHEARFDAAGLTSGIYLYRLQAGEYAETRKFVLLR